MADHRPRENRPADLWYESRSAGGPKLLTGSAACYGEPTNIGPFWEMIAPGAFERSLAADEDILALLDHDPAKVLGRTKSGTLRLTDEKRRLFFELDAPDTGPGRDAIALAQRGDLGGASIGFIVEAEREERDRDGGAIRVVERARLLEISIVSAWPAYAQTTVEARRTLFCVGPQGAAPSPAAPRLNAMQRYLETVRS